MPNTPDERRKIEQARRRGILRIRTVDEPGGKYAHVYVTRKAGPKGGHTVMTNPKEKKNG